MSLEKTVVIDQITVAEDGDVFYREVTRILEGGKELTKTYHRTSLHPGDSLTGLPEKVVAIATTVWTPEVVAAYQAKLAELAAEFAAQQTDGQA